jgi:hypothetical protein
MDFHFRCLVTTESYVVFVVGPKRRECIVVYTKPKIGDNYYAPTNPVLTPADLVDASIHKDIGYMWVVYYTQ